MRETLHITYMNCGFCTAKNHCEHCGRELAEALAARPGVSVAVFNIPDHTATVDHALDSGSLEDLLDGMGLIVE